MASGPFEVGHNELLKVGFQAASANAAWKMVLLTAVPDGTEDTVADLSVDGSGNYTPVSLTRNATNFPVASADDDSQLRGELTVQDGSGDKVDFTASGGDVTGILAAAIVTDTGGTDIPIYYWDLSGSRTISDGQTMSLKGLRVYLRKA